MQDAAHLLVHGEKILVLRRFMKHGVKLKLRISGQDGMFLEDESLFLEENLHRLDEIKAGKTVYL